MAVLRKGSRGPEVSTLQAALNFYISDAPLLQVDGIVGPKTLARVVEFQGRKKLTQDGVVGPKTEAALYVCA